MLNNSPERCRCKAHERRTPWWNASECNAACLVRPSKSVLDLEVKSLKKKFKDKAFAAGVDREVIRKGCEMLNVPLDDIMRETIEGMKEHADEIGLKGAL